MMRTPEVKEEAYVEGLPVLFEGRGQIQGSFFHTDAREVSRSPLEDLAAGLYVQISKSPLYVGAEAGLERYAQTLYFNGSDTLSIDQKPAYIWAGGSMRYQALDALPYIKVQPYFQVTAGLTSVGPLARLRLGGIWEMTDLGLGQRSGGSLFAPLQVQR